LVTGAGGFVGQHLSQYLASVGDDVLACPGPGGSGSLDVTDAGAVAERILSFQPEGIVHLAGISSVAWSHAYPSRTSLVNGVGTVNVLQGVREHSPKAHVLVIGSGEMYGRIREGCRAHEDDTLRPLSPYSASKCASETFARQYAASYGVHAICVRPFNHIGRGQASQFVVPSLARQIAEITNGRRDAVIEVGDLTPVRDFLHVRDVVRGYRLLLERGERGTPYNLCSGQPCSIRSLLEQLLELSGVKAKIHLNKDRLRPAEIPWLVGDAARIQRLGWKPEDTVHSALAEALAEAAEK